MTLQDDRQNFFRDLANFLWEAAPSQEAKDELHSVLASAHTHHIAPGFESLGNKPQGLRSVLVEKYQWIVYAIEAYQIVWNSEPHAFHCDLLDEKTGGMLIQDVSEAVGYMERERFGRSMREKK